MIAAEPCNCIKLNNALRGIFFVGLHSFQQLHVSFIPSSSFHLMIQLQDNLILKLKRKRQTGPRQRTIKVEMVYY